MTRSHSRRAVTYKTWLNLRWWLLLTLLFLWMGWLSPWLTMDNPTIFLRGRLDQLAAGGAQGYQIDWTLLWMVALGALPMALERSRGALLTTLAGPVRRRDLYNLQCACCLAIVWLGLALLAGYIAWLNASLGGPLTIAHILGWLGRQLLSHTAALMVGLAAGTIIGNYGMAVFCGIGVAGVPIYASLVWSFMVNLRIQHELQAHPHAATGPDVQALAAKTEAILRLSPLVPADGVHGPLWTGLVLWFVLWSAGWYALGLWLFERLPLEREGNVFSYPVCWHLLFAAIGLMAGFMVTVMSWRGAQPPVWQAFLLWSVASGAIWLLLALARRIAVARRQE
ncbi:hypothetical protein GCM10010885_21340 [Alicyclobacillus cellulosilyticus]|uniref:ABC-2 family transporter n=1 Tax=Alicyclobacillus cellulosilyticus TaxID=1003997 RepID=A0A917KF03_9BACL|nr:hypothetical protein [Alicyclobacillus cellulosilyticus]GGJ11769.1 hypothetical protein GCM10010885_21340 [Alicyclobacillus cellulosilyticus]